MIFLCILVVHSSTTHIEDSGLNFEQLEHSMLELAKAREILLSKISNQSEMILAEIPTSVTNED